MVNNVKHWQVSKQAQYSQLAALGAGQLAHSNGSLIQHLTGTQRLLSQWGAATVLQDAGLYHAVYGTDGFDQPLLPISERARVAKIIGFEAEAIVYLYGACDRSYLWPTLGTGAKHIGYKDRFTGQYKVLTEEQLSAYCELTVANELEIAQGNAAFVQAQGEDLLRLFTSMRPYLSDAAYKAAEDLLKVY